MRDFLCVNQIYTKKRGGQNPPRKSQKGIQTEEEPGPSPNAKKPKGYEIKSLCMQYMFSVNTTIVAWFQSSLKIWRHSLFQITQPRKVYHTNILLESI